MTICLSCKRYFMDASSCTVDGIRYPDDEVLEAIPYGGESADHEAGRCPDCGVERGGFHHPECAVAECPRCGDRLSRCGCLETA